MKVGRREKTAGGMTVASLVVAYAIRLAFLSSRLSGQPLWPQPSPPAKPTYDLPLPPPLAASETHPFLEADPAPTALRGPAHALYVIFSRRRIGDASIVAAAKRKAPALTKVSALHVSPNAGEYVVRRLTGNDFPRYGEDELEVFGKDLGADEKVTLSTATEALVLDATAPAASALSAVHELTELAAALAEGPSVIVDAKTQHIISARWFVQHQVGEWQWAAPPAWNHVGVYLDPTEPRQLMVTSGMRKFGLPDVVIDRLAPDAVAGGSALTLLICQTLLEGGKPDADGRLVLDVDRLAEPAARARFKDAITKDGAGKAVVRLVVVKPERGHSDNWQVTIDVAREKGASWEEKQMALMAAIFGHGSS